MAYAYGPALVAFCRGTPVEEIAAAFNIPLNSLKAKIRQEGWRSLANEMSPRLDVPVQPNAEALAKCEANRTENYETAAKLRDDLSGTLAKLREGTLRIKRQFHNKGQVIEYESEPGILDRLNLATYARTVAELTYRALGDHEALGRHKEDAPAGAQPPTPPLTIVLPNAVAKPRDQRSADSGPVIEVESASAD